MASDITDLLSRVTDSTTARPVIAALAGSGKAIGASSITITDATGWTTASVVYFSIYQTQTVGGVTIKDPTTQTDWKATLSGTTLSNLTLTGGTDRAYVAGDIVEQTPTARYAKDMYDNIRSHANQDGSLIPSAVKTALALGSDSLNGWNPLAYVPNTVTYNGNRSYDLVFSGQDLTGTLSNGMRLRTTRTVTAPTQSTSLNGTSQYFSKAAPSGMTFTDDFTVSAWVKLSSYAATDMVIASRYNGTSGWDFFLTNSGQVVIRGYNAGSGNLSQCISYQSIPFNKWVHITAQLDMSTFTATTATSYIMIDGVDVPVTVGRAGTNPTALVQAGNLEIGSRNGGTQFFPGKIAQVAIYNAKVTQATIRGTISQTLAGTETSLISAYSFNNSITDLNTTNANNLTTNGSAVATNADSPFTQDDTATPSGTLDFAIIQKKAFSTNTTLTVQVPEGCAIPTSGGVTAVAYASQKVPYGFPASRGRWTVEYFSKDVSSSSTAGWQNLGGRQITLPIGDWSVVYSGCMEKNSAGASGTYSTLSTTSNSETNLELTTGNYLNLNGQIITEVTQAGRISQSAQSVWYLNAQITGTISVFSMRGDFTPTRIVAEPSNL